MNQEELIYKLSMFEQQIKQFQEQILSIEQGIQELQELNKGLSDLEKSNQEEIFAGIGKGIFIKAKMISKDLIVDIGNENFIRKTIPETIEVIKNQIKKLLEAKVELNKVIEELNNSLNETVLDFQHKKFK